MIFKRIKRNNSEYPGYKEPIFDCINRSSSKEAADIRKAINKWFSFYPKNEKPEFLSRIQTNEDQEFLSAFSELYIYNLCRLLGFKIKVHPKLDNNSEKKPDFLLSYRNEEVIVESVLANEMSYQEKRAEKIINVLLDSIDKIKSNNYLLSIDLDGTPTKNINSKTLVMELQKWLNSLNHNEVNSNYINPNHHQIYREFLLEGLNIEVSAIPKPTNYDNNKGIVGVISPEVVWNNTAHFIGRAVDRKATRYGKLNKPYILVINIQSVFCGTYNITEALFGTKKSDNNFNCNETFFPIMERDNVGKLSPKKNTRLSGVMILNNLQPWNYQVEKPVLYLNPWAKNPYYGKLLDLPHYFPENGIMKFNIGKNLEIFQ